MILIISSNIDRIQLCTEKERKRERQFLFYISTKK